MLDWSPGIICSPRHAEMNLPLATYNGLEVDMLSVGDADSTLVTRWTNGVPTRVLIDGGNKSSASTLKLFLLRRRIRYVDHVIVCTHPHDDHAAGLIELVTDKRFDFGMFWMHLPWKHVDICRRWMRPCAERQRGGSRKLLMSPYKGVEILQTQSGVGSRIFTNLLPATRLASLQFVGPRRSSMAHLCRNSRR